MRKLITLVFLFLISVIYLYSQSSINICTVTRDNNGRIYEITVNPVNQNDINSGSTGKYGFTLTKRLY